MNDEQTVYLADCLIKYHVNSFKVRTYKLASAGTATLPIAVELNNLKRRLSADYEPIDLMSQAVALKDIIDRGKTRITELIDEAQVAEDPNVQLEEAKKVRREMKAAEEMLEKLNG
ncbi:MAG: hypothetical protein NWE77_01855 [Candidatus Bathyarchaeota archaeon]|jgi:hypothetical protein|nr:hypothetical protein [Candidatus Bathyarchaeota archaeon]